jgi:hypothetical protein
MRAVAIVVIEAEADWPSWILFQDVDIVAVADQRAPGGEPSAWTAFVHKRLERLGRPPSLAVLACNPLDQPEASAHRAAVAHALLGSVGAAERGHLVISASGRATSRLVQGELVALTASLGRQLPANARVSLRCGGVVRTFPGPIQRPRCPDLPPPGTAPRALAALGERTDGRSGDSATGVASPVLARMF